MSLAVLDIGSRFFRKKFKAGQDRANAKSLQIIGSKTGKFTKIRFDRNISQRMVFRMYMNRMLIVSMLAVACTDANQLRASQDAKAASTHAEFVSEIIPIKYARAEEIANVLNETNAMTAELKNRLQLTVNLSMLAAEIKTLGQRTIVVDQRSNSLSVWASPCDLETIKDLIEQLDVTLAQILVEGVIVRLPLNGSNWKRAHIGSPLDPCPILSKLSHSSVLPEGRFVSSSATNGFGESGSQLSYVARFNGDLDAAKDALATNIGVLILQRPRIQTSTSVTAELLVTGNYPVYAAYYGGGSYCSCVSSLQVLRTNGSAIDLTYLVSKDGLFLTDIRQVVDMATGSVYITNVGDVPITKRNESEAHIAVRDRETIVLGGLIETVREPIFSGIGSFDQIPSLGDFLNKVITYPTRKVSYEIIALIRATMLPVPELPATSRMPLVRPADAKVKAEELKRLQSTEKDTRALEHGK